MSSANGHLPYTTIFEGPINDGVFRLELIGGTDPGDFPDMVMPRTWMHAICRVLQPRNENNDRIKELPVLVGMHSYAVNRELSEIPQEWVEEVRRNARTLYDQLLENPGMILHHEVKDALNGQVHKRVAGIAMSKRWKLLTVAAEATCAKTSDEPSPS